MDDSLYKHHRRVIEWMLNGHSTLRDRYTRRSRSLTLTIIGLSIAGLTLALANGDQQVTLLGLHSKLQVYVACLAALTFFVALFELVVDWHRRQWAHTDAAVRLGELSMLFRRAERDSKGEWRVDDVDLALEYERVMRILEPFPNNKAGALKAASNRKRAVFTLLDERPGIPVWWAQIVVTQRALVGKAITKEELAAHEDAQVDAKGGGMA